MVKMPRDPPRPKQTVDPTMQAALDAMTPEQRQILADKINEGFSEAPFMQGTNHEPGDKYDDAGAFQRWIRMRYDRGTPHEPGTDYKVTVDPVALNQRIKRAIWLINVVLAFVLGYVANDMATTIGFYCGMWDQ